jgi:hypothetical protein
MVESTLHVELCITFWLISVPVHTISHFTTPRLLQSSIIFSFPRLSSPFCSPPSSFQQHIFITCFKQNGFPKCVVWKNLFLKQYMFIPCFKESGFPKCVVWKNLFLAQYIFNPCFKENCFTKWIIWKNLRVFLKQYSFISCFKENGFPKYVVWKNLFLTQYILSHVSKKMASRNV